MKHDKPPLPLPDAFDSMDAIMGAFAHHVGGLISFIDTEERIRFSSRALAEWFGSTPEAIQGKTLRELYGAESYALLSPWVKRALAGEEVHYERQAILPGVAPLWISVNLRPYRDAGGKVGSLFSCALAVSELQRAHDAPARALSALATHIETTPLAGVEWPENLRVKRWSPQAEAIFGWTVDE